MVIRLFLDNRVWVLLLLPAVLSLYLVSFLFGFDDIYGLNKATISIIEPFLHQFPSAHILANFLMLLINALALNWIFNSYEFLEKNTYIISLLYLIFTSFFHNWGDPSWLFVAHLCSIFGFGVLFSIKPQHNAKKQAFNAGFLFGLSLFFETSFVLLLPVLLVLLMILRGGQIRELLLLTIGYSMPFGFYMSLYFLANHTFPDFPLPVSSFYKPNWFETICLAIVVALFGFSLLGLRARLGKASLRLKKQTQILTVFMFLCAALGLATLFFWGQAALLSLLVLPFSFYFAYALLSSSLGISSHLFFYLIFTFSVLKFALAYYSNLDF